MSVSPSPDDELGRTASMSDSTSDVTRLLVRLRSGEAAALDELLPAVCHPGRHID